MFKITFPEFKKTVSGSGTILEIAKKGNIFIPSPCEGKGICKKCRVKIEGKVITKENKIITSGSILACEAHPVENTKVWIEREPEIVEELKLRYSPTSSSKRPEFTLDSKYLIACDVGTSTVSLSVWRNNCKHIKSIAFTNPQKRFGDDVLSRVSIGIREKGKHLLHTLTVKRIKEVLEEILYEPTSAVFTGNSVMIHILLGKSLKPFSKAPYRISFRGDKNVNIGGIRAYIPPLISPFLGADFVTGIAFVLKSEDEPFLYIDIGTNTEIGLFTGKNIVATSTPAGSALEGEHITSGMPPVKGAIKSVKFKRTFIFESKGKPIGICGSGLIDLIATFLQTKIVEASGKLNLERARYYGFEVDEEKRVIFIQPDVPFSQDDVRKFQLARSAIRSGVELVAQKSGMNLKEIKKCYLAGSFGENINIKNFRMCGFLPGSFRGEIIKTGNSALKGAIEILFSERFLKIVKNVPEKTEALQLPDIPIFEKTFISNLEFDT